MAVATALLSAGGYGKTIAPSAAHSSAESLARRAIALDPTKKVSSCSARILGIPQSRVLIAAMLEYALPPNSLRMSLLGSGRCRIELAVTLLDPSGAKMALHCDADMVRAVFRACQVKFLSGPAGSQGQDALAQARRAGHASR